MMKRLLVIPRWLFLVIAASWFAFGLAAGAAAPAVARFAEIGPPPPAITQIGEQAVVVRFTAHRAGVPVQCTLSLHFRSNAWSLSC